MLFSLLDLPQKELENSLRKRLKEKDHELNIEAVNK
jgi:hypothetical protein